MDSSPYLDITSEKATGPTAHLQDGLTGSARMNFIKKVYMILTLQLLITVGFCCLSYYCVPFLVFQIEQQWLMWLLFAIMIVVEIAIFCSPAGRKHPYNLLLLLVFTLGQAYMVSFICSVVSYSNEEPIVLIAAGMTLTMVVGLSVYAIFTKTDFSNMWGILIVIACSMLTLGIVSIFAWSPFLDNLYCSLGVILFGIYLIFDTQMIAGGRRMQLETDDYVVGALILYMDIIQIFLYILQLLSKKK